MGRCSMSRLVAVTGACGALGSAVASQLVERGYEIAVIDLADCGEAQRGIVAVVGVDLAEPIEVKRAFDRVRRSEEHTSELQSLMRISYAVFCLKKNKKIILHYQYSEAY